MNIALVMLSCLFSISLPAYSQEGSADFPSISAEAGHIYIANHTKQRVTFYLESKYTDRTEHVLGPGQSATFSGDSRDQWFNIEVFSNNQKVAYGLDAGTRHYFEWRPDGVLDVYKLSPR
ncbi:hypothetical protein [Marinobacter xestospongiae]|uniref:hypothetical protein n=1 Tax=Marinobacter xestospongiae TaxID=994319 RepID=UPI002006BC20|nr:hypothetical protein [Marinobacter xestospongiae]MCK7569185.1 hypothetical protein [Marinobacter xestospongiae]